MSRCLLDTDILSEIIKGKNTAIAARASVYVAEHARLTTSSVSVAEIVYGFRRMDREDRIAQFEASLETAEVLPFDDDAGRLAGRINADLERQGRIIGLPDVMIAAIALVNVLPRTPSDCSRPVPKPRRTPSYPPYSLALAGHPIEPTSRAKRRETPG